MIVVGAIVVIVLAIGAFFIRRHEAQLVAEAERALPGPLKHVVSLNIPTLRACLSPPCRHFCRDAI